MPLYTVTITPQYGSIGDPYVCLAIPARNKAEAIREARKQNRREMFYDRFNGRITYTAERD